MCPQKGQTLPIPHKEDPPLGHGAPKPSQRKIAAGGTAFGFQVRTTPPAPTTLPERKVSTIARIDLRVDKRVPVPHISDKNLQRLPLPPAKIKISDRFPLASQTQKPKKVLNEVVPDSEEECMQSPDSDDENNGDVDKNNVANTDSSTEEESSDDENPGAREEEDTHMDLAQEEQEMDPYAEFDAEDYADQNRGL
jgi:hypothetical protein